MYLIERFVRIYLVFAPAMVLTALIDALWFCGSNTQLPRFTVRDFAVTISMLSGAPGFSDHLDTFQFIAPAWTLNYEFYLYILYGITALSSRYGGRYGNVGLFVLLLITAYLAAHLKHFAPLAFNWVLGVVAASLHQAGIGTRNRPRMIALLLAALVGCVIFCHLTRSNRSPLESWTVVSVMGLWFYGGILLAEYVPISERLKSVAYFFASYSYSMYLIHYAFIVTFLAALNKLHLYEPTANDTAKLVAFLLLIALVNLAAYLFSLITERHTGRVRKLLAAVLPGQPSGKRSDTEAPS